MKKWEYKRYEFDTAYKQNRRSPLPHIAGQNELGEEGWELVSVIALARRGQTVDSEVLWFKRPLEKGIEIGGIQLDKGVLTD